MAEETEFSTIHRIMDASYFLFMIVGVIVYFANRNLRLGFIVFITGMVVICIAGNIAIKIQEKMKK